ncbi:MAG: hypothetical protein ACPGGA_02510 [Balneolaceae bacterium]
MKKLIFIPLILLSSNFFGCKDSSTILSGLDELEIAELKTWIINNYPEYELVRAPINEITTSSYFDILPSENNGHENIFSYDLNNDGFIDYIFHLFKTRVLENDPDYDFVVTVIGIHLFGTESGFEPFERNFSYREFVYPGEFDDRDYITIQQLGVVPAGIYQSDYESKILQLNKNSLGVIGPFSTIIVEYFSPDSSRIFTLRSSY